MPRSHRHGRPVHVDSDLFCKVVRNFADRIYVNSKIISKNNPLWKELSLCFDSKYTPLSLHTMIVKNSYGVLDEMKNQFSVAKETSNTSDSECRQSETNSEDSTKQIKKETYKFSIEISVSDFTEITEEILHSKNTRKANECETKYLVFKSGVYEQFFDQIVCTYTSLNCSFDYASHYLSLNRRSGSLKGSCHCGSRLKCKFSRSIENYPVLAKFHVTINDGKNCVNKKKLEDAEQTLTSSLKDGNVPDEKNMYNEAVHIFEGCYFLQSDSEEGCDHERICEDNKNIESTDSNVTVEQESEKTAKNIEEKSCTKPSKNLSDQKEDVLQSKQEKALSIIKNGNDIMLAPVTVNGKKVTLRNTCAFDCLLYMAMLAASDFPSIKEKMNSLNYSFYKLILNLINGLNPHTYTKRTAVLSEYFEIRSTERCLGGFIIDCNTEVGWLAKQLFKELPSLLESSTCCNCHYNNIKQLTAIQIEDEKLKTSNPATFIENFCVNSNVTQCPVCCKESSIIHRIIQLGEIVIFQIYNEEEKNNEFQLDSFHKVLINPLDNNQPLHLHGVVSYRGKEKVSKIRKKHNNKGSDYCESSGHYTAFVFRQSNSSWIEIDDLQRKSLFHTDDHKVVPRLLMYVKPNS